MAQTIRIVRSIRTSALLCRTDVLRQITRRGTALDPLTGDRVTLAYSRASMPRVPTA